MWMALRCVALLFFLALNIRPVYGEETCRILRLGSEEIEKARSIQEVDEILEEIGIAGRIGNAGLLKVYGGDLNRAKRSLSDALNLMRFVARCKNW